jgi:hypothetical protein
LDAYRPDEEWPAERVRELGITHLRLASDLYLNQETANTMTMLRRMGFTLLGGGADHPDALAWLLACGVIATSGTMTGILVDDDNLVLDTLAREEFGPIPPSMPEPEPEPEPEPDIVPESDEDDDDDDWDDDWDAEDETESQPEPEDAPESDPDPSENPESTQAGE